MSRHLMICKGNVFVQGRGGTLKGVQSEPTLGLIMFIKE